MCLASVTVVGSKTAKDMAMVSNVLDMTFFKLVGGEMTSLSGLVHRPGLRLVNPRPKN